MAAFRTAFKVPVEVGDEYGVRFEKLDAILDPSATLSEVPERVMDRLGIAPQEIWRTPDTKFRDMRVSTVTLRIAGHEKQVGVVFGKERSLVVLGNHTLTQMDLIVDDEAKRVL